MNRSSLVRLVLVAAVATQACQTRSAEPSSTHDVEVRESMERFLTALNQLDLPAIDRMFTDDVSAFVPTVQGTAVRGRAAMRQIFEGYAARFADGPPPPTVPQEVNVSSSDNLGVVSFVVPDSVRGVVRRRTFVFRQDHGVWRISHYHASDFSEAPATR